MRDDSILLPPPRAILLGFLAGLLAVLAFHQVMLLVVSSAKMINATPYSMTPTGFLGVPTIVNSMFWGGLWGALFGLIAGRTQLRMSLPIAGLLFGLFGPLITNWFLVSPSKGRPVAAGFEPAGMLAGVLIAGAFGLGTALIYGLLARRAGRDATSLRV